MHPYKSIHKVPELTLTRQDKILTILRMITMMTIHNDD